MADQLGAYQWGDWYLDLDGSGVWNLALDRRISPFGAVGLLPLV